MTSQENGSAPKGTHAASLEAVLEKRVHVSDRGRPEAVAKQHSQGKYTARERIALLLDPGSFLELGGLVEPERHTFDTENLVAPGDGVITGFGRIDGRPVCIASYDYTVVGGSNGNVGELKMYRLGQRALEHGTPLLFLLEGGGHRIQEGLDSRHFAAAGVGFFQIVCELSGYVPIVGAVLGMGFAGPSNFAGLCDYVVMVRGISTMGLAGPVLVEASSGEKTDKMTLGGAETQVDKNGIAHAGADSEEQALALLRGYLSYLPTNAEELPPRAAALAPNAEAEAALRTIIPDSRSAVYDVREVIHGIIDEDTLFEIMPTYAKNIVTGFARIEGRAVGILANQTAHLAGTLDAPACEKGAHFISVCDAFGLPLLYLIDVPGFLIGSQAEDTQLARRSARLVFELGQATVARISVVLRKGYGFGYYAMCGGRGFGADLALAWPSAEICALSVEGAVDVAYRRQVNSAPDPALARAELIARFRTQLGSLSAAEHFGIDDVIDPLETRAAIAQTLDRVPSRKKVRATAKKRHGISPI